MHKQFEEEFIGMILDDTSHYYECSEIVKPKHIRDKVLRDVYGCMGLCVRKTNTLEISAIASYVTATKDMDIADYLMMIRQQLPRDGNAVEWARMIRDESDMNEVEKVLRDGVNRKKSTGDFLDELLNRLIRIRSGSVDGSINLYDSVRKEVDRIEERIKQTDDYGWNWGVPRLKDHLGLITPSELYTIAAPSGIGKTSLAMQIAYEVGKMGNVEVFQVDIAEHEQARKTLSTISGISVKKLQQSKELNDLEFEHLMNALAQVPKHINMNLMREPLIENVRMKCLAAKEKGGLALVIADHSKLFRTAKRTDNQFETMRNVYKEAKMIALETGCAFIMLNQITRDFLKRNTWKLKKSDIWGGEEAAENSDCVLLLNRPEAIIRNLDTGKFYTEEAKQQDLVDWEGLGYIEIAKNRYGPEGERITLDWNAERTVFYEKEGADMYDQEACIM